MKVNFFENVEVTLKVDVETGDEFNPLSPELFERTGVFGEGYEICVIKAGSKVWASMIPSGHIYLTDSKNSIHCHAMVTLNEIETDAQFPKPLNPVPGKPGMLR